MSAGLFDEPGLLGVLMNVPGIYAIISTPPIAGKVKKPDSFLTKTKKLKVNFYFFWGISATKFVVTRNTSKLNRQKVFLFIREGFGCIISKSSLSKLKR